MNIALTILLWITYSISLYCSIFWFLIFLESHAVFKKENKRVVNRLKRYPLVTIAIPAYNEEKTLAGTLKSVVNLDYPKEKLQVIVINDGSKDNTKQVAQAFIKAHPSYDITLINQRNQGKGHALNNALKKAKGEFFSCIDADSFVRKKTLRRMLHMFENSDPDLAIVTPAMRVKGPNTLVQRIQQIEYILLMYLARIMSRIDCLYVAPGPFSLYRTSVLDKLGGFDADNLTEDQEIAYRAQAYHYKVRQCFDAYVDTVAPDSMKTLYYQRNRWFKGGLINALKYRFMMFNKEYGDFGLIQMNVNMLLFFLSTMGVFFFGYYMIWPVIKGAFDLALVGFDIWPYLANLKFSFNPLSINVESMLIVYLMLFITVVMLYFSYKNADESLSRSKAALVPYFLIYYLLLSMVAVIIMMETAVGKKQKW